MDAVILLTCLPRVACAGRWRRARISAVSPARGRTSTRLSSVRVTPALRTCCANLSSPSTYRPVSGSVTRRMRVRISSFSSSPLLPQAARPSVLDLLPLSPWIPSGRCILHACSTEALHVGFIVVHPTMDSAVALFSATHTAPYEGASFSR
jgi:hypothetical protein